MMRTLMTTAATAAVGIAMMASAAAQAGDRVMVTGPGPQMRGGGAPQVWRGAPLQRGWSGQAQSQAQMQSQWQAQRQMQSQWQAQRQMQSQVQSQRSNVRVYQGGTVNRTGTWSGGSWNGAQQGWTGGHAMRGGGYGAHAPRWGGRVDGRWWGGQRAPGGWGAYRRPVRGWALPSYWIAPTWYVSDWSGYGLPQPPQGYSWSRYYDDAVLIDGRGSVYDTIGGIDWDRYDGADVDYTYRDGYANGGYAQDGYAQYGYDQGGYAQGYAQPGAPYPYPQDSRYGRRDNGLGGAAIGAVAGGVAGNLIGGRGNRVAGTLVGAGVGAAAGYAIDKAEDRGRGAAPAYGYQYEGRGYDAHGYDGRGAPYPAPVVTHADGTTVTTTTTGGAYPTAGYYAGGFYYPGTSVTTVSVASAPVVTTTTEVFEDRVTYSRPAHHSVRKVWRAKPKCYCK